MKTLFRETNAYKLIAADALRGTLSQSMLVLFSDGVYLRPLLKECAKAFFGAGDGTRLASLIDNESYADCLTYPSDGGKLTADDAAKLIDESLLRPVEGDKKLFVLDGFQKTTALVQNKLLKILEEPPAGVYFLIGATAEHAVLPTVLSRMKKFAVAPFGERAIADALTRKYGVLDGAQEAAAACGGVFSLAEQLLSGGGESFRLAEQFLLGTDTETFCRTADKLDKTAFFASLNLLLRDMLFYRTGQARYAADKRACRLAETFPEGAIIASLERVREAEKQIQFNANLGQCLYALAIGMREEKQKWQKLSS